MRMGIGVTLIAILSLMYLGRFFLHKRWYKKAEWCNYAELLCILAVILETSIQLKDVLP